VYIPISEESNNFISVMFEADTKKVFQAEVEKKELALHAYELTQIIGNFGAVGQNG
jgi:hypothetical protein